MWDWASFSSGVLGALLGSGSTFAVAALNRRDARTSLRRELVNNVAVALQKLDPAAPEEQKNRTLGDIAFAASALSSTTKKREAAVVPWIFRVVADLAESPAERWGFNAAVIASQLHSWSNGETPSRWFAAENARLKARHGQRGRPPHSPADQ